MHRSPSNACVSNSRATLSGPPDTPTSTWSRAGSHKAERSSAKRASAAGSGAFVGGTALIRVGLLCGGQLGTIDVAQLGIDAANVGPWLFEHCQRLGQVEQAVGGALAIGQL